MKHFTCCILSQYNPIIEHLHTFIHPTRINVDEENRRVTVKGNVSFQMSFSANEYKVYFYNHDHEGNEISCFRIMWREGIIEYLDLKKVEIDFLSRNAG